jgi:hypothetical protein
MKAITWSVSIGESRLITGIPAATAASTAGTSALDSAGTTTIRSTARVTRSSMWVTWPA